MGSGISSNTAGFIGSAVAIVGFGSNFVPVKHVETGDGKFRRVRAESRTGRGRGAPINLGGSGLY